MGEDTREIAVTVRIKRKTWFQFGDYCRANHIPIYRGVEQGTDMNKLCGSLLVESTHSAWIRGVPSRGMLQHPIRQR
jgi:hypothetical protein